MAKVFACKKPAIWAFDDAEMGKPPEERKDHKAFAKLRERSSRVNIEKTLVGVLASFPFANSYAHYLVIKNDPLTLEHVPFGDAWRLVSYAESGLVAEDIRDLEKQRRNYAALLRK